MVYWDGGWGPGSTTLLPPRPGAVHRHQPGPPSPAPGQSYKLNNNKNLDYIKLVAQSLEASLIPRAQSTHRPPKPALGGGGQGTHSSPARAWGHLEFISSQVSPPPDGDSLSLGWHKQKALG